MTIKPRQMLTPTSKYDIKCPYSMKAEAICVHNTANDASANNEVSYMNSNNNYTSYHFAIDDKEVVQGLPLDRNGFHAGDGANGYGNRKTIGIEICYSKSGGDRFVKAEKLAAQFIAQLLAERGWSIDRVHKHQDYSGKYCPHRTLDMGWQRFLNMVESYLKPAEKVIDWRDVKETTGTVISSPLIDLKNGTTVKTIAGSFTYVQTTADGKYGRTAYSKEHGQNYGVLISDIKVKEPEPVVVDTPKKPAVKWKDVLPVDAVIQGSTDLVNVETSQVITRVSGDFTYVQVTEDEKYARTDYSKEHNLNNGVLLERLTPKDEAQKPDAPEKDDDGKGQKEEPLVVFTEEQKNWLTKFITDLFTKLFKKG